MDINKVHVFQNKVLRNTAGLPRVTLIEILREQTSTEIIQSHVSRLARKLYLKRQLSNKPQIRLLGQ
jgi:hypothetical protein